MTSRSLESRDMNGNNNKTLTLNAGWYTDAIKSHYNVQQLDLSLSVTYNSGSCISCSISGNGLNTRWCYCTTTDPSSSSSSSSSSSAPPYLISSCAAVADISSTDASAPVLPNNMYVRWRPVGSNPAIASALCGWRDQLGNWDPKGQCKGFGMINPGRWIMSNVANWIENYVSSMRPDIALALPVDEPMEEQRVKIDGCWKTGWKGDSCPTAVSKMPIQPPWSPNGKRDQLGGSTTSGGNAQLKVARAAHRGSDVLSLQAGWITDAAALHYNTGSIPMTLSFKWNAGSGLQ